MSGQARIEAIDAALARGEIDAAAWHERVRELLETAYLAAETPQGGSGSSGDAAHWQRRRGVIAEAIHRDGTLFDIGCANGLLMQSLVEWAAARGYQIEPFGLDISAKLVAVARARLPAWHDRIFSGNALTWQPPRRFDFVRTELVYVPEARQPDLVQRLLDVAVEAGGRPIICAYRPRGRPDPGPLAERLRRWGYLPGGEHVAIEPADGSVKTRVSWFDAPRC